MVLIKATVNGVPVVVDSGAPTVPVEDMDEDGGDIVAFLAKWLSEHVTVLNVFTDAGSGDISTVEAAVALNTTHRTSDGSDHTFIDQDLVSGAAPTFVGTNFTAIPTAGLVASADITRLIASQTQQPLSEPGLAMVMSSGHKGVATLTAGRTLPLMTGAAAGDTPQIVMKQDGIGGHALDTTAFPQPDGVDIVLSTAPNAVDILSFYAESPTVIYLVGVKNFS